MKKEAQRSVWEHGWIRTHAVPSLLLGLVAAAYVLEPLVLKVHLERRVGAEQLDEDADAMAASSTYQDLFWQAGEELHQALETDPILYFVLQMPLFAPLLVANCWLVPRLCFVHYKWDIAPKVLALIAASVLANTLLLSPLPSHSIQYEPVNAALFFSLVVTRAHVTLAPRVGILLLTLHATGQALHGAEPAVDLPGLRRGFCALIWLVHASTMVLACHQMHSTAWLLSLSAAVVAHVAVEWLGWLCGAARRQWGAKPESPEEEDGVAETSTAIAQALQEPCVSVFTVSDEIIGGSDSDEEPSLP